MKKNACFTTHKDKFTENLYKNRFHPAQNLFRSGSKFIYAVSEMLPNIYSVHRSVNGPIMSITFYSKLTEVSDGDTPFIYLPLHKLCFPTLASGPVSAKVGYCLLLTILSES